MCPEKNLCSEKICVPKIWIPKKLDSQKNLGPKKFWVLKYFGSWKLLVKEKIWHKKKFGSWRNFGPQKIKSQKFTPSRHLPDTFQTPSRHLPDTFQTHSRHLPNAHPFTITPIDQFCKVKLGVILVVVTLENKVNSEPDLFKFVQVRSGWVPSRVGVWQKS